MKDVSRGGVISVFGCLGDNSDKTDLQSQYAQLARWLDIIIAYDLVGASKRINIIDRAKWYV